METSPIKIYFDIQKPFYYPGEQILGSIFIEFLESINCNQISIISKGKQYIKINRKNISCEIDESFDDDSFEDGGDTNLSKNRTEKNMENIDESKTIYKYQKNLKINNNSISKGKYTFPLEIDIPDKIPGSFLYIDNDIYIEIIHTIKIKFSEINYKEVFPIIIRQKEKEFNYPKFSEHKKILGECCWERGESTIKINPVEKYNLLGSNIKFNVLINNEQSGMGGTPVNIELYQKLIFLPKDKLNKIRITKLVGKSKGNVAINKRKNFNEDISVKIKGKKIIDFYKEKTKAYKYFKNEKIIDLLTPSIKSDLVLCEYEIYIESQFVGWFKEELGVFNKIILYPPEKGILNQDMDNISKEFLNSLVIKKIFLNEESKDDEIVLGKNKKIEEGKDKSKNKKEKEKEKVKSKKNKSKEKNINENKENININNEDINENFNINNFKKKNNNIKEVVKHNNKYNDIKNDDNININNLKKNFDKDFFDEHALDDDFLDNSSEQ